MRLQKFRHSCLLLDVDGVRLLLDPGAFSRGFESLTGLGGVLVTHSHPDHLDVDRVRGLLAANPDAEVLADPASAALLGGGPVRVATPGESVQVAGVPVSVYGGDHAHIAPGVPTPPNVGYVVGGRFAYGGDAYVPPPEPVDVVALPTVAPWLKAADSVAFLQTVRPRVTVPVHEALLASTDLYYGLYRRFADEQGTRFLDLDDGEPVDV